MRCLAVCQDELLIRILDEILLPGFEVEFILENRPAARRLHDAGIQVITGDPRRIDTYVKADLGPSTCVIVEDNARRNPKKILEAVRDAGGTLVYVLGVGTEATERRAEEFRAEFPDVAYLAMSELFGGPLLTEFSRSLTRARVQQYQRLFTDADRVLIMLHNDPDPDAMASGLALRNVLDCLESAGLSFDNFVSLNCWLGKLDDSERMLRYVREYFPRNPPALAVIQQSATGPNNRPAVQFSGIAVRSVTAKSK